MAGGFHPEESVMGKGPRRGQNQQLPPSHGKREAHGGKTGAPTVLGWPDTMADQKGGARGERPGCDLMSVPA